MSKFNQMTQSSLAIVDGLAIDLQTSLHINYLYSSFIIAFCGLVSIISNQWLQSRDTERVQWKGYKTKFEDWQ